MTTTSNMGLTLPDPNVTEGPAWATLLNAALSLIDTHDHSSGKGVKVTPAGFNFTSNMPVAGYELQDVGALVLRSLTVDKTVAGSVYCKAGELYWVSANGTAVQLTSGTGLNLAATGTIGGDYGSPGVTASASYSDVLKTYSWLQSPGVAAKTFTGDILLTFPGASENSVTLKAQTGSAAYSFSFPLLAPAAADSVLFANTSGVNVFKVLSGTTNQITVTSSSTAMTFSLPQNIHTGATPTFAGLTLSGLTASYAVVTNGSKVLSSLQYTSANTASTLVSRGASGEIAVGAVTATSVTASSGVAAGPSAPTVMTKKLTVTWPSGANNVTVNHGLSDKDKIIAIHGHINRDASANYNTTIPGFDVSISRIVSVVCTDDIVLMGSYNLSFAAAAYFTSDCTVVLYVHYEA